MSLTSDAVVVGGGVVGASVAYHLAKAGAGDVLVCEQGRQPGLGATSQSGGLLRQHHTARCDIRLAVRGVLAFADWGETVGGDCGRRRTGFALLVDERYGDELSKNVAAINEAGGASEIMPPDELTSRHPGLRPPPHALVAYEHDGGYADPVLATGTLLARARDLGVRYGEGIEVRAVGAAERVVGVDTNIGRIWTPLVVLAAGAWSATLAAGVGVDLPITPRRIGLAQASTRLAAADLPVCIDDTTGVYFRPDDSGDLLFGVPSDPVVGAGNRPAALAQEEIEAARSAAAERVPRLAAAAVVGSRAGLDGYTPDGRPAIGAAGPPGLYLCAGFSGGGFKIAPTVGELVAAEIVGGLPEELLVPYRPERFAAGTLIESENPYARI